MKVDMRDRTQVVAYVIALGSGHTVFKDPEQALYNIILTSRKKDFKIPQEWVIIDT